MGPLRDLRSRYLSFSRGRKGGGNQTKETTVGKGTRTQLVCGGRIQFSAEERTLVGLEKEETLQVGGGALGGG